MLDGNFSDEEDEFLKNFCQNNKISYDNFIDYQKVFLWMEVGKKFVMMKL